MAKKSKNSNYQTPKKEAARIERENQIKKEKNKKLALAITIPLVSVLLLTSIVLGIVGSALGWFGIKATHYATIITDKGTMELELYGEEAPETVANFVKLANDGYYNGADFHRIIDGFMAQGGIGDGTATAIKGEFWENGYWWNSVKHERGTISMARTSDPNSATSQFFIVHKTTENNSLSLDGKYAAFGKVIDGFSVIDKLCNGVNSDNIPTSQRPKILAIYVKTAEEKAELDNILSDLDNGTQSES